jgi:hypothetical protein
LHGNSAGEKENAHGEVGSVFDDVAELGGSFGKKRVGDLCQNTRAVTGFHVGVHGSAVGHAADGGKRVIEDFVTALAVEMGDGTHAAVVVFL